MAYEHLITADWHNKDVFTAVSANVARSNTYARTGTWSFNFPAVHDAHLSVVAAATKYVGFGAYFLSDNANGNRVFFRESTTEHLCIVFNTVAGTIEARRGNETGTLLGSGGTISTNTWYYIGIKGTIDNSAGVVEVWLDGVKVIDLSSQDTQNGGTATVNNIWWEQGNANVYIDDIKIRDDAVPSVGGLYVKVPSADGGTNGWTPSAGDEYQCVDEAPPTFDDYISTDVATTNTLSNFAHAGMSAAAYDSIDCVAVVAYAQLDAAGAGNVRMVLNSNGTESDGTSTVLSTSPKYISHFVTADPDTSAAWAKSGVDAALFGVETI